MLVIVQARSSSKRFRNKVLKKIHGKTIIYHVVNRLKKSKLISDIIVATSKEKSDNKLVSHLRTKNIKYFRGGLNNVAKRMMDVAINNKAKFFVRISGDSPLIDFRIINLAINTLKKSKVKPDIVTNIFPRTYPIGQSVEIIKSSIMIKNLKKFNKLEKEHVTQFFYNNHKKFIIKNFKLRKKHTFIKLAIDEKKDLFTILKKFNKKKFQKFKVLK